MLRLIAAAALALAATTPAMAQVNWTSDRMGSTTYHNGTDRRGGQWHGTTDYMGGTRYDNITGPGGRVTHCTTDTMGGTAYTSCN